MSKEADTFEQFLSEYDTSEEDFESTDEPTSNAGSVTASVDSSSEPMEEFEEVFGEDGGSGKFDDPVSEDDRDEAEQAFEELYGNALQDNEDE